MESDSVNENLSLCSAARKKNKYKRLSDADGNTSGKSYSLPIGHHRKGKAVGIGDISGAGDPRLWKSRRKRKHILKKKSSVLGKMCADAQLDGTDSRCLALSQLSLNEVDDHDDAASKMDTPMSPSSSSISSSDSEGGTFTHDEGLEGDDEQSDWVGEKMDASEKIVDPAFDPAFERILSQAFRFMSAKAKANYKMMTEGREVANCTARLRHSQARCTIPLKKFQSSLSPMDVDHIPRSRRNTYSGIKRKKRKQPSCDTLNESELSSTEVSVPIDESNLGNRMLRNLGWKPGNGLGPASNVGITEPLIFPARKKYQGLGHGSA